MWSLIKINPQDYIPEFSYMESKARVHYHAAYYKVPVLAQNCKCVWILLCAGVWNNLTEEMLSVRVPT